MKNTHIEWCDHTFNPWEGCAKVSPGCAHCYAETRNARFGGGTAPNWGKGAPRRRTSVQNWNQVRKWDREAQAAEAAHWPPSVPYERPRVFCASLADWLDDEVPVEWFADLLDLIRQTPNLDWLLLTKRPENWRRRLIEAMNFIDGSGPKETGGVPDVYSGPLAPTAKMIELWCCDTTPPANVWIGTTVEDQARAGERIPQLLGIPARVRFLSCEPLLGPVDLINSRGLCLGKPPRLEIDWVICGGESGPDARPMHPDWARNLRDQCADGVPFLFKQWGEWAPGECVDVKGTLKCASFDGQYWDYSTQTENQSQHCHADDAPDLYRVGKKHAGRLLDGVEHNGFPTA